MKSKKKNSQEEERKKILTKTMAHKLQTIEELINYTINYLWITPSQNYHKTKHSIWIGSKL